METIPRHSSAGRLLKRPIRLIRERNSKSTAGSPPDSSIKPLPIPITLAPALAEIRNELLVVLNIGLEFGDAEPSFSADAKRFRINTTQSRH
jgi:hypothetical protein